MTKHLGRYTLVVLALTSMVLCQTALSQNGKKKAARQPEIKSVRIALKEEPRLGSRLAGGVRSSSILLPISPSRMYPSYEVSYDDIEYTICVNGNRIINYISTETPDFRTPEGIAVGNTLEKVLEVSQAKLVKEKGWAFVVPLKSGWKAAFIQGASMTEGELAPNAPVIWLFKRGR